MIISCYIGYMYLFRRMTEKSKPYTLNPLFYSFLSRAGRGHEVNNNEAVKLKKVNLNKVAIQDIKTLLVISSS